MGLLLSEILLTAFLVRPVSILVVRALIPAWCIEAGLLARASSANTLSSEDRQQKGHAAVGSSVAVAPVKSSKVAQVDLDAIHASEDEYRQQQQQQQAQAQSQPQQDRVAMGNRVTVEKIPL